MQVTIEHLLDIYNRIGYDIQDNRHVGLGFSVNKSPYTHLGIDFGYSSTRKFYVTVSSRERTVEETKALASALETVATVAGKLNEVI